MTPAQLRAMLDAATKRPWGDIRRWVWSQDDIDAIVATMNAADALHDLWAALRSTGYTYRPDSEDPVERRIADALRRLEELKP